MDIHNLRTSSIRTQLLMVSTVFLFSLLAACSRPDQENRPESKAARESTSTHSAPTPVLLSRFIPTGIDGVTRFGGIFAINPDGTGTTDIIGSPAADGNYYDFYAARYNHDRTRIAMLSNLNHPDQTPNVFTMNLADGTISQITYGDKDFSSVDWSVDDSQLLVTGVDDNEVEYQVQVMNADGSGITPLTSGLYEHGSASWSPDGSTILYDKGRPWPHRQTKRIWAMNADGSNQHQLVPTDTYAADPYWSPDGNFVVYSTAETGGDLHLRKLEIATGNITTLTQPAAGFSDTSPVWTSSGIVFTRSNNPDNHWEVGRLYIMDENGGNLRPLTEQFDGVMDVASDG